VRRLYYLIIYVVMELHTRGWQVKISFPARKFLFLFPPQNLIVLSGVLVFFSFVLFLSVSSPCLFPTFFFTFPIFAAIFCFFFVNLLLFPHQHIFPQLFPYNLCLTDLKTVWQPRFQVWEFDGI
jgi:hypothetical protein